MKYPPPPTTKPTPPLPIPPPPHFHSSVFFRGTETKVFVCFLCVFSMHLTVQYIHFFISFQGEETLPGDPSYSSHNYGVVSMFPPPPSPSPRSCQLKFGPDRIKISERSPCSCPFVGTSSYTPSFPPRHLTYCSDRFTLSLSLPSLCVEVETCLNSSQGRA
jgi:hypothetical protein